MGLLHTPVLMKASGCPDLTHWTGDWIVGRERASMAGKRKKGDDDDDSCLCPDAPVQRAQGRVVNSEPPVFTRDTS